MASTKDIIVENDEIVVPDEFVCPLTLEVMKSPMMTRWGQSYDREAILQWLGRGGHKHCPLTRKPLTLRDLLPNRALKERIQQWKESTGYQEQEDQRRNSNENCNQMFGQSHLYMDMPLESFSKRKECAQQERVGRLHIRSLSLAYSNVSSGGAQNREPLRENRAKILIHI